MTWELTLRTHMKQPEPAEDSTCSRPSNTWKMSLHTRVSSLSGDSLEVLDIMPCARTWITPMVDSPRSHASTSFPSSRTWNQMPWLNPSTQKSAPLLTCALRELSAAEEERTEPTVVSLLTFLRTATSSSTWPSSLRTFRELIRLLWESRRSKPPSRNLPSENEEV